MERICAWCKQTLESTVEAIGQAAKEATHGICETYRDSMNRQIEEKKGVIAEQYRKARR